MIDAVLFDLDDTLYPQFLWLDGAWERVSSTAASWGVDPRRLQRALVSVADTDGSAGGRIIDRALAIVGARHVPVAPLVAAFMSYRAPLLTPYPHVPALLGRLRSRVRIGLVTDGDEAIQRSKVRALGFHESFDTVVYSGALGRRYRKPHPLPFQSAMAALGVTAAHTVFVGDHPVKDVAGPRALGMRSIRVLTGEYAHHSASPPPWSTVATVADAARIVMDELGVVAS